MTTRNYYQTHREERLAYKRNYYQTHKEKCLAYKNRYAKTHRKDINQKQLYRIEVNGKRFYLDRNPRTGKCSYCNEYKEWTGLYYKLFNRYKPLDNSIELCHGCALALGYTGGGKHSYPP